MKKKLLLLSIFAAYSLAGLAQDNVGINTLTPDPSAVLDVQANDKGVLIPRLTTEQRELINNAATGLLVFDTNTSGFWFYNGTAWVDLSDPNGDDVWQKNGDNIYYSQGKVGIGTSVPGDALTIQGTFATHTFDVNNQLIKSFSIPGWSGDRGTIINGLFDGRGFGPQIRFQGLPELGFIDIGNNADGNFTVEGINDVPLLTVEQGGDVKAEGRIKNVSDPVENQDAATKSYVDAGDPDPGNELELPADPQAGDMAYYDGSGWMKIPKGSEGQVLTVSNGIPVWGGGDQLNSLLKATLPNGQTLYVHPTDNSASIPWGDLINITVLPEVTDANTAAMDFDGENNTQAIVDQLQNYNGGSYAAKLCADLVAFGFDDWYLPAAGELNAVYLQLGPDGNNGFVSNKYWSSTEESTTTSWRLDFPNAELQGYPIKNGLIPCRCVRK